VVHISRVVELCLHFTSLFVVHRVSASKFRLTPFPDVGYNERLPLAPWAETNRQPAISRNRYSVRTICGVARCELRTGSYRSSGADCVGVRRRRSTLWRCASWIAHGITSVATHECQETCRLSSVRSEFRMWRWSFLIKSCARDLGRRRSMVATLERRGKSSLFADDRFRCFSWSSVFDVWQ